MKKLFIALFAMAFMPLLSQAAKYEEGKHYNVIPGQATTKPEVREYFFLLLPCMSWF